MLYEISRIGKEKDYIYKINHNFENSTQINGYIQEIYDIDSMEEICEKINNNFAAYDDTQNYTGLNCNIYPQMERDSMFHVINENFKIINPTEELIFA